MHHRIKLLLAYISISCLIFSCKKTEEPSYILPFKELSDDAFSIVFSANLEGYIAPCGCTSNPLGGLDRFATIFNDIKKTHEVILISTGNLLFENHKQSQADQCQEDAKLNILLPNLNKLGLKYTAIAGNDSARGEKFFQDIFNKHNISIMDSVNIIKINNMILGIFIIDQNYIENNNIKIHINELIKKNNINATLAISQLPSVMTKKIFADLSDIDVVIQANTTSNDMKMPELISSSGPWMIEGGKQGQYFTIITWQHLSKRKGRLFYDDRSIVNANREEFIIQRLKLLHDQLKEASDDRIGFIKERINIAEKELLSLKKIKNFSPLDKPNVSFNAFTINKKIKPMPTIKKEIDNYDKTLPLLSKKCEENIECPKAKNDEAVYVGDISCKSCHAEAYNVYKNALSIKKTLNESGQEIKRTVGHSKAWQTLVDIHKENDRSCIGCHSVGFMKAGGYCKTSSVGNFGNVQCESCHGAGSLHAKTADKKFINRAVSEHTCRSCHHTPHIESFESFNYERDLIKILGKGHGEKLLNTLIHKKKHD